MRFVGTWRWQTSYDDKHFAIGDHPVCEYLAPRLRHIGERREPYPIDKLMDITKQKKVTDCLDCKDRKEQKKS
jgi:hypothetical protein